MVDGLNEQVHKCLIFFAVDKEQNIFCMSLARLTLKLTDVLTPLFQSYTEIDQKDFWVKINFSNRI